MGMKNLWGMILAVNIVAAGVLYQRFQDHPTVQLLESKALEVYHKVVPPKTPDRCGAVKWPTYVLVSERVVLPGGVQPAAVFIKDKKIVDVRVNVQKVEHEHVLNFKDNVISPGVIDVHAHLNEPGREEWEGMTTGTAAAVSGGVTTIIDMPLNSDPVTTTIEQLRAKQAIAPVKAFANVGFWAGLVPENAANHTRLAELVDGGALGFKSFMCNSGINDFQAVGREDIAAALPFLKSRGVPFFVHAEVTSPVNTPEDADPRAYLTYMGTRPPKFEQDAIRLLIELLDADTTAAAAGFRVHIAHLADSGCLDMIKEAQARHPLTVETCAHYLTFSSEEVPDGATAFKCAPPIRDAANKQALTSAVASGAIVLVSSDHSPAPPSVKEMESGSFLKAWGGISGIQYLLPATWTALKAAGGDLMMMARVLSEQPAQLAGLAHRKGVIKAGMDADLVVWEPEGRANTSLAFNHHKHKLSPYTDRELLGKVVATVVGGELTTLFGNINPRPCGQVVSRKK